MGSNPIESTKQSLTLAVPKPTGNGGLLVYGYARIEFR